MGASRGMDAAIAKRQEVLLHQLATQRRPRVVLIVDMTMISRQWRRHRAALGQYRGTPFPHQPSLYARNSQQSTARGPSRH